MKKMIKVPEGYFCILRKNRGKGKVLASFPDHPNILTYGKDWNHAEKMAREALAATLEVDFERGFELPECTKPKIRKGQSLCFIPLTVEVRTAYLLRAWREGQGLTQK